MRSSVVVCLAAIAMLASLGANAQTVLEIDAGVELSWDSIAGRTYQPQWAAEPDGPWFPLAESAAGSGGTHVLFDPGAGGGRHYRVLEIVEGTGPAPIAPLNGGFELGDGPLATHWTAGASQPPQRSSAEARSGTHSMRVAITNATASPNEGLLTQDVVAQGGSIGPGASYEFSFWAKQISSGPSYIQQYQVQWLNAANAVVGGTGLINFNGVEGVWTRIAPSAFTAPANATEARVQFRFVTGAVPGGHGEVFIDDVALDSGQGPPLPAETNILSGVSTVVTQLRWPTVPGIEYQPEFTTHPQSGEWIADPPPIVGDGSQASRLFPMTNALAYFRVSVPAVTIDPPSNLITIPSGSSEAISLTWTASPSPGITGYRILYGLNPDDMTQTMDVGVVTSAMLTGLTEGQTYYIAVVTLTANGESPPSNVIAAQTGEDIGVAPLFDAGTQLEPPILVDTPTALITYLGDRARDRHAREHFFSAYDHYLPWYWEQRTMVIEIIDTVARGGSDITFNYWTLTPLGAPEFRAFFRGIGTVAEYHYNTLAPLVGPNHYRVTLTTKLPENRPLEIGDRLEFEISMFLAAPANGRANYYATTFLYIVGEGIVPWQAGSELGLSGIVNSVNLELDSYPLPENAWLGGRTTLPYQYSDEPQHRFKQLAGNVAPTNVQPFMLGRRLHHTDFGTGAHSEPGNPVFTEHVGKLGPAFIARSCVECHVNNSRALPPAIGAPMYQSVVRVAADASGTPHPVLGSVLQPRSTTGTPEGSAVISSYTYTDGQYGDGTPYTLRRPNYTFSGVTPTYYSVRLAPPLVGLGLLEAVGESTILGLSDPNDANSDGISGRIRMVVDPETGQQRLGRFTFKGGQARLSHQIAAALNLDMGVTTHIFPLLEGETSGGPPELSEIDLDHMVRYVAVLGVGARRDLNDPVALQGEQLFQVAQCATCHTPTLQTSPFHPMAELRDQTIHPYTDLLLHDMGPGLADNLGEAGATGSEWRTAPLWNIGLNPGASGGEAYLHDGRARTLEEAILWHGGEAEASKELFRNMSAAERAAIVKFLQSL